MRHEHDSLKIMYLDDLEYLISFRVLIIDYILAMKIKVVSGRPMEIIFDRKSSHKPQNSHPRLVCMNLNVTAAFSGLMHRNDKKNELFC